MSPRLLVDENTSHRLVAACRRLEPGFPIVHITDWQAGALLAAHDTALLLALREARLVLVSFDRASLPLHGGRLTRESQGHAGIILFRRAVPLAAFGAQARLLVEFWQAASTWDWADRIDYLPREARA